MTKLLTFLGIGLVAFGQVAKAQSITPKAQISSTQQRLAVLRTSMDQAYEDKLDGKLDEQM
jgi:hypothetical protein